MIDDAAFALNQPEFNEATLLYLEKNRLERRCDKFRDLLNEAVLVIAGVKDKDDFSLRAIKALEEM
jgi:hypothetical protein